MKQILDHINSLKYDKGFVVEFFFIVTLFVLPFKLILSPISLLALFLVMLFFNKPYRWIRFLDSKVLVLMIIFYLYQVFGLFYSISSGLSYGRISTLLPLLVVPIIFSSIGLTEESIQKAKNAFVLSCAVFCILALIYLSTNLVVNFEHRRDYNFIQTSMYHFHYPYDVLFLNVANVFLLYGSQLKKYRLAISFLFLCIIVLSGVRMGLFMYILTVLLFFVINFKRLLNLRTLIVGASGVLMAFFLINNSRYVNDKFYDSLDKIGLGTNSYISEIGEGYHKLSLRNKLWKASFEVYKTKPLFGFGPKGSEDFLNKAYEVMGYKELQDLNSHNQYLTTLLNHGPIGLFVLILILLLGLKGALETHNIQSVIVLLIIVGSFFTESMLERQKGVTFFAIILTLIVIQNNLIKVNPLKKGT